MKIARAFLALVLFAASLAAPAALLPGFDDLEATLRLNREQKAQFDVAVATTQRALLSVAFSALQLNEHIAAEFAKSHPDLGALARAQDALIEQNRPLFRDARIEWARLYAMLDPEQVKIARSFVEEKMARLEALGNGLRDLIVDKLKKAP
jgi:hypothetical protein